MVKKITKIIVVLFVLFSMFLSGCFGPWCGKEDLHDALQTMAINDGFGYMGSQRDGIRLEEEDSHGRIMFTFWGNGYCSAILGMTEIMICQYIDYDNNYVYYYPDSYIAYKTNEKPIASEIQLLKELNDWDKEIDLSKCVRKKIDNRKDHVNSEKRADVLNALAEKHEETLEFAFEPFVVLCDVDKNGKELYGVTIPYNYENFSFEHTQIFSIIFDNETQEYRIMLFQTVDGYIEKLTAFKAECGWEYNYVNY